MASVGGYRDLGMGGGETPCAHTWAGRQKAPMSFSVGAERQPGAATRCPCHALWMCVSCQWAASVSCNMLVGVQVSQATLRAPWGWDSTGLLTETGIAWTRCCQSSTLAMPRSCRLLCLEPRGKSPVLAVSLGFAGHLAVLQPRRLWGCNHRIYGKESITKDLQLVMHMLCKGDLSFQVGPKVVYLKCPTLHCLVDVAS